MIINNQVKALVSKIENLNQSEISELNYYLKELVLELKATTSNPKNKYTAGHFNSASNELMNYPLSKDNYALAIDPLIDEEAFIATLEKYGIVVGSQIFKAKECNQIVTDIYNIVNSISNGKCDLNDPETWKNIPLDKYGVSLISRGFLEIYHNQILANMRQAVKIYIHHVVLWGRYDLWTSFDRLGIKLPNHEELKGLPLHVDQNPLIHSDFKTIQGVLALSDCSVERGTFVGVPGSRNFFLDFKKFAPEHGDYVEISKGYSFYKNFEQYSQAIPIRKGDLITWDSRTVHANSENISNDTRLVAYIAAGIAKEQDQEIINTRVDAFRTGIGSNVREALMHASKKSRYTDYDSLNKTRDGVEQLMLLGELLYGIKKYNKLR